jgi:hypothetical protein
VKLVKIKSTEENQILVVKFEWYLILQKQLGTGELFVTKAEYNG